MLRNPLLSLLLLVGTSAFVVACSDDPEDPPKAEPEPTAVLIIDREALDFGEVEVGQASPEHLFTVRNASPAAAQAVSMALDGTGFAIVASTCERFLDAGRECQVRV